MADSEWEPEPVQGGVTLMEAITNVGLLALAVCAATFLVVAMPTRTAGATRSARLQGQQRQQQIESAVAEGQPAAAGQQATKGAADEAAEVQR